MADGDAKKRFAEWAAGQDSSAARKKASVKISNMAPPESTPGALIPATPSQARDALWQNPESGQWEAIKVSESSMLAGLRDGTLRDPNADAESRTAFEQLAQNQEQQVEDVYSDLQGSGEALVSGLTLGLHRQIDFLYTDEERARYEQWTERNPGKAGTFNAVGFVLPSILTMGGSTLAQGSVAAGAGAGKLALLAGAGRTALQTASRTTLGKALSVGGGGLGTRAALGVAERTGMKVGGLAFTATEGVMQALPSALMATLDSAEPDFDSFGTTVAAHGALGVFVPVAFTGALTAAGAAAKGTKRLLTRNAQRPEMHGATQRAKTVPDDPAEQEAFRDALLEKAMKGDVDGVTNFLERMLAEGDGVQAISARKALNAVLRRGSAVGRPGATLSQEQQELVSTMVDDVFVPLYESQRMARFGGGPGDPSGIAGLTREPGTMLNETLQVDTDQAIAQFGATAHGMVEKLARISNGDESGPGAFAKSTLRKWFGDLPMQEVGDDFAKIDIPALQQRVDLEIEAFATKGGRAVRQGAGEPLTVGQIGKTTTAKNPRGGTYEKVVVKLDDPAGGKGGRVVVTRSDKSGGWGYKIPGTRKRIPLAAPTREALTKSLGEAGVLTQDVVATAKEAERVGEFGKFARAVVMPLKEGRGHDAYAAAYEGRKAIAGLTLPAKVERGPANMLREELQGMMGGLVQSPLAWGAKFQEQRALTEGAYEQLIGMSQRAPAMLPGATSAKIVEEGGAINRQALEKAVRRGLFGDNLNSPAAAELLSYVGQMMKATESLMVARGLPVDGEAMFKMWERAGLTLSKRARQLEVLEAVNALSYRVPGASRSQSWQRSLAMAVLGMPGAAMMSVMPWRARMLLSGPGARAMGTMGKEWVLDRSASIYSGAAGQAVKRKTAETAAKIKRRVFRAVGVADEVIEQGTVMSIEDFRRRVGVDRIVLGLIRAPVGKRLSDSWGASEPSIEERYEELSSVFNQLSGSPEAMLSGLGSITEGMYAADPTGEYAGAYGDSIAKSFAYAVQHMPTTTADPLTGEALPPARAEIKEWFYALEALDDPNVICEYVATGLVKQSGVQAVREAYPEQFAQYVLAFAQKALATGSKLTYAQKLILGEVTGMNLDPTEESSFIMAMNQDYSQTPEQSAALGQVAAMQAQGNAQAVAFQQAARRLPGSTGSTAQGHRNDLERLGQA
ncbi:MAG: hypothetical protein GY772_00215 [bacterium]|nr:hypothetical protein [bacterium]MCP4434340.1 hypothetical protein [Actinomycetes bacterium]